MRTIRLHEIEDYISKEGVVSFKKLCDEFHISINTARRDVSVLMESGKLEKVYGGVKIKEQSALQPYDNRSIRNIEEKRAICECAAKFIQEGDIIYIDSGTTLIQLLDYVPNIQITVITSSLPILTKASQMNNINLYILQGVLNRQTNSFQGADSCKLLEQYNFNKCFMSASGLSISGGVTHASPWEFKLKTTVISKNIDSYLLIDHTKFDRITLLKYADISEFKHVVTDAPVSKEYVDHLARHDVALHIAGPSRVTHK